MKIFGINLNIFQKSFLALLSFIFGIALLVLLFFFIEPAEIFAALKKITLWQFGLILALRLVFLTVSALKWKIILDFYKHKVSFWKLYMFKFAVFSVSYFTPITAVGGQAVGVVLLKNEKVPVKIGITTILIDSILTIFISVAISFFALILFLLLRFSGTPFLILVFFAFFLILLFLALFFIVFILKKPAPKKSNPRILSKWKSALRDFVFAFFDFFKKNKRGALNLIALNFFGHLSILLEIFLILFFLGINLDVIELAVVEAGYTFAFILPVSQALGTAEAAGAYTLQVLGHSAVLGVSLTLILRIRHLFIGLIGIAVLIFYGLSAFIFNKSSKI